MKKKEKILSIYSKLLKQENYPNISKIVALFDFWLDLYFLASNYKKSLPRNCLNLYVAFDKESDLLGARTKKMSLDQLVEENRAL